MTMEMDTRIWNIAEAVAAKYSKRLVDKIRLRTAVYSVVWAEQTNAAIANQNLAIAQARKFDHDHADEIAMCKVEGRQVSASVQLRIHPILQAVLS